MRTYGLIGFPLSHSFSQKYFSDKFKKENITDCEFKNFSLESIDQLSQLLEQTPTLCGLSVTIPHKKSVMRLLNDMDPTAKKIGAVNCIRIQNKKLTGYNTDVHGFEQSLKPLLNKHHKQALILGTGGASNAIAFCLNNLNIPYRFVSRKNASSLPYSSLSKKIITESNLIVNTTPLGTFPNINDCPAIPYQYLTPQHLLYDLTYNPEETLFLKKGKEKGTAIKNGYEMLCLQAEKAWDIWNNGNT